MQIFGFRSVHDPTPPPLDNSRSIRGELLKKTSFPVVQIDAPKPEWASVAWKPFSYCLLFSCGQFSGVFAKSLSFETLRSGICTATLLCIVFSHLFVSAETEHKCLAKDSKLSAMLKQYWKYVECNLVSQLHIIISKYKILLWFFSQWFYSCSLRNIMKIMVKYDSSLESCRATVRA